MKKILLIVLAAASIMAFKNPGDILPIGATLPNQDIKMKDISGTEVSFKDAKKKNGLLVMFICNTCPVVKKYQARTLELAKYAQTHDIGVILLNSNEASREDGDSYNDMRAYAKTQGFTFNYALDKNSTMADAFGADRTPEVFIFNREQKLAYHGAIDDNQNSADEVTRKHAVIAIDEMLAGKSVSTNQTRSVGCAIKRKE